MFRVTLINHALYDEKVSDRLPLYPSAKHDLKPLTVPNVFSFPNTFGSGAAPASIEFSSKHVEIDQSGTLHMPDFRKTACEIRFLMFIIVFIYVQRSHSTLTAR